MAEQLTLEKAAENVAKAKETLDNLRKQKREVGDHFAQVEDDLHKADWAYGAAKQALLEIALHSKGDGK